MDEYTRFWQQIAVLEKAFGQKIAVGPLDAGRDSPAVRPTWVAEQNSLLVRGGSENVSVALRYATCNPKVRVRHAHGVTWLPIKENVVEVMHRMEMDHAFRKISPRPVTPNHLITIAPVNACPADEPSAPEGTTFVPPPASGDAGDGVDILVVDTGLVPGFHDGHPQLLHVAGSCRDAVPGEFIPQYYGHGMFIASLLALMAPKAHVTVRNDLRNAGAISEFDLGKLLLETLATWQHPDGTTRWPDIISLSAGAPSQKPDEPLLGLAEFLRQLGDHQETVLVAAAGNDGHTVPFWPAAAAQNFAEARPGPGLVSVGALRGDGCGRACFSNYGDWVSVFARGERLVSVFAKGPYRNVHGPTEFCRYYRDSPDNQLYPHCTCRTAGTQGCTVMFDWLAQWSGTSFATPIIAGRIAAAMRTESGQRRTAREAVAYLWRERLDCRLDKADGVKLPVLRD